MKQWISMEEARDIVLNQISDITELQEVSIFDAVGRIAGRDYIAEYMQPPFDRSPLDGFALNHADILNASNETPVTLRISQKIFAGDNYQVTINPGEAARIMTGAGIPAGADCVIRQEDVTFDEEQVTIYQSMKAHDNICDAGEDMRQGTSIIHQGEVITPSHGAVLAGQGNFAVQCFRQLNIGVLSTGSELIEQQDMLPGKIFNSNGPMVSMRLQELGMKTICKCCSDQPEVIRQYVDELRKTQDIIITTGGVSVGDKDYLPAVMEDMGAEILFHGVAMKPGSPMLVARLGNKMIFCLSGNPFAAMATLELIALPGLCKATGRMKYMPTCELLQVENPFLKASKKGRRLIRAVAQNGVAYIPDNHSSGSIASMIGCNCLLDIPGGSDAISERQELVGIYLLSDSSALSKEEYGKQERRIAEKKNSSVEIPTLCICGSKNVGKTTMMEKIVSKLSAKGYQIATIKHDGHTFVPDVPTTDSARFFAAGASTVSIYAKDKVMLYEQIQEKKQDNITIQDILYKLKGFTTNQLDLILIEGMKNEILPKIEIVRKEISTESVARPEGLLAICSDVQMKKQENVCIFDLNDIDGIVDFIIVNKLHKQK